MKTRSPVQRSDSAVKISIMYVLIGSLWIILSDKIIDMLHLSDAISVNLTKGIFYVLSTALILYLWVKGVKKALTESEERYGAIVEHSPEPVAVHRDGKIVFINPAGAKVVGAASPEEVIGHPIVNFIHPDFIDKVQERVRQVMVEGRSTEPVEQKIIRMDGQVIDVEVRSVPIKYQGKTAVQLLCKDITERKLAERMLEEKEQAYKSLVDHNPDAIFTVNLEGSLSNVNPATIKITGYPLEELLLQEFKQFIIEEDRDKTCDLFKEALLGESTSIEIAIRHKSGHPIDLNLKMVPIIIHDKIEGVYGIAKDITKRKRTEELLIKSEKLSVVGQLAAGVAHEIRNPLTSLRGFVQLFQAKEDMNQEYLQIMLSELDRINDIVSEFLVIAKPQALSFEVRDVRQIYYEVISLLETQATLSNVQILAEIADDIPMISCQQNQLKQVFINILKNAIESMTSGGSILIQMKVVDQQIRVRFIDNGCGISEERLLMLGEPFYTTKEKGTGLGLMVCHKIIEAHGGTLHIASQLNQGTTVDLILPIEESGVLQEA
ncbi:PAS domain-containing sensor histidine kinase [Paenibacillus sp. CF384]|uniref:PAS domain-containing sensor histidine kinase n=1 Tax=Paenibacillus sp. CF384 TaxID=1884382 RepID=UPI0008985AAA|nr:PAS domain-containing sensor histidine kinase [Paenibacillus sp. CF384]SDX50523.1 PAS domain S-box-containing protein [Paenibacillus sp. CF384]